MREDFSDERAREEFLKWLEELFKEPIPSYAVDYGSKGKYTK